jgi:hypothetical protein
MIMKESVPLGVLGINQDKEKGGLLTGLKQTFLKKIMMKIL